VTLVTLVTLYPSANRMHKKPFSAQKLFSVALRAIGKSVTPVTGHILGANPPPSLIQIDSWTRPQSGDKARFTVSLITKTKAG
jgi:hypothetical protein